jgi:hypothetical protein
MSTNVSEIYKDKVKLVSLAILIASVFFVFNSAITLIIVLGIFFVAVKSVKGIF